MIDVVQDSLFDLEEVDDRDKFTIFTEKNIIDAAFVDFRKSGFPYRNLSVHACMQEINKLSCLDDAVLPVTTVGYMVADTYHKHRFSSSAESMRSPIESFAIDKSLLKALTMHIKYARSIPDTFFGMLNLTNGTQACSNFRPGFALSLYRKYCKPGAVVLDTSTGYGGRLIGFMALGCGLKYIGIDPNAETHNANIRMSKDLNFLDRVELYNVPAEDMDISLVRNRCDFAFTSPPYFRKEHYSDDETQSYKRYPEINLWVDGFLKKMVELQYAALKNNCYSIININDIKLGKKEYKLSDYTIECAKEVGFEFIRTDLFRIPNKVGLELGGVTSYEKVLVFKKAQSID